MRLGDLLVGQGLATAADVDAALQNQRRQGGRLGTHLVAMGILTVDQLVTALRGQQEVGATLAMCARTFQRSQMMYGAEHPKTQRARYSYARALLAAGRGVDALKNAEAALASIRKSLGENHAWTDDALQLVADARHVVSTIEPQPAAAPAA